jgi:hypothetical protein
LPAQDHSQPALAVGGITVSPLPLIIVRFLSVSFDGNSDRLLQIESQFLEFRKLP